MSSHNTVSQYVNHIVSQYVNHIIHVGEFIADTLSFTALFDKFLLESLSFRLSHLHYFDNVCYRVNETNHISITY